jgi:hypothetical protein
LADGDILLGARLHIQATKAACKIMTLLNANFSLILLNATSQTVSSQQSSWLGLTAKCIKAQGTQQQHGFPPRTTAVLSDNDDDVMAQ